VKARLFILTAALALTSQGCALLNAATSGRLPTAEEAAAAKREADRLAALGKQSVEYAEKLCNPILKEETPWEEERAVGGVVAVSKYKAGKAFMDGMTERDPVKLADAVTAGKPMLAADSPKNDITSQVAIIGRNLARLSGRPDLPWTFGVVTSDTPNALSTPGGYVMVTTGLLKKVTNEAQLAGVLAHEIAHVVYKHSLIKYRDGKNKQCIAANTVAYLAENGVPPSEPQRELVKFAKKFEGKMDLDNSEGGFIKFLMGAVIELLQGKNDAQSEFDSDKMAIELVAFAGYDTSEYEGFLTSLGSSGGFLSSHPATEDRVAKLKAYREGELAPFATGKAKGDLSKLLGPVSAK